MDSKGKSSASSSSKMENLHFSLDSLTPITPLKPISPQTMQICEEARQGSQMGHVSWPGTIPQVHPPGFPPLTRDFGASSASACDNPPGFASDMRDYGSSSACNNLTGFPPDMRGFGSSSACDYLSGFSPDMRDYGSSSACNNPCSYFNINQTYNNWGESVHNVGNPNLDMERLNCLPFGDLLALANNIGPMDTNFHGQTGFPFNYSSLLSMIGNTAATNELQNGGCDLNFPPVFEPESNPEPESEPNQEPDPGSSKFFFTNLTPVTPTQSTKIVINDDALNMQRVEKEQEGNDKSRSTASAQLHENINPANGLLNAAPVIDPGGGIDLNKTPNQKPRRRKHRPKVVREDKPKKTPKSVTPTPAKPPGTKRKYVRKNTTEKVSEGTTSNTTPRSSKRRLVFEAENKGKGESFSINVESQAQNFSKETEITIEKTDTNEIRLNVFSNKSHENNILKTTPVKTKSTPRSPNGSNCSSNENLTKGKQSIEHIPTSDGTVLKGNNMEGVQYNSLDRYVSMLPMFSCDSQNNGITFPAICKRKRSGKVYCGTSSNIDVKNDKPNAMPCQNSSFYNQKSNFYSPPQFTRSNNNTSFQNLLRNVHGEMPPPPPRPSMSFDRLWTMTKKRSKGATKVRNIASLMSIVENKKLPLSSGKVPKLGHLQEQKSSLHIYSCMEALAANNPIQMKTKKRTRRRYIPNGVLGRSSILNVDVLTEFLGMLDINRESIPMKNKNKGILVPFKEKNKQNALVLYRHDGTIMPYGGAVKKKAVRPKVDLDEETNRVWKLLLEDINSEGINGTDEAKVKWWEDERTVFQGRAESFIARMHLVQGDRRFSPWKGSVLDSVVGVFLTQNVSDHLSSSAFMSLAARFPLKSEIHPEQHEETIPLVEEPEVCIEDGEKGPKWDEGKSRQPDCTIAGHNEMYSTLPAAKEISQTRGTVERSIDNRQQDDEFSPQSSVVCSNNSVDSVSHIPERLGPCLQENLEADQTIMSNPNGIAHSSSCVELLQNLGTSFYGVHRNEHNPEETMSDVQNHKTDASNNPNLLLSHGIPSGNMYPQMINNFEVVENDMPDIESKCPNISRKSGENSRSEQSAITTESVHLPIGVKMTTTIYEASRCSNENNQTNSCKGKVNEMRYHQCMPDWDVNCMDQTVADRQQVLEVQNLHKEALLVSESTSAINGSKNTEQKAVDSSFKDFDFANGEAGEKIDLINASKTRKERMGKEKVKDIDWDKLRRDAQCKLKGKVRSPNTMNSLDWEAVRSADVGEISKTIKERGMNNMLAERIQAFLNRMVKDHGSTDLEWLREVPPDKAKEYLLSIRGLGLKSVECVRLLTLHHLAFPVDTNVGRIAVRLGWVPIQPLPESLQLHLLELYPVLESIQKYLWPRLCKLDQKTLYELHYQMITFGKVFCTKSKPNCNACPMRGECRHFASAFASERLSLPAPEEKRMVGTSGTKIPNMAFPSVGKLVRLPPAEGNQQLQVHSIGSPCEPIVEMPTSPEPIIEVPSTPEPELQKLDDDIEDSLSEGPEEIPVIRLDMEEFSQNLQNYVQQKMEHVDGNMSNALVALTPEAASIPTPKLKNVSRLRTEHQVYELPDSHYLLAGLDKREPDDPCSYMLAIWTPGETPNSVQPPKSRCNAQESGQMCNETTCFSCNSIKEANSQIVRGTILIPCRTAMRGSFPLNGTYFQVNEVFADDASSQDPIDIPRSLIWNLPRRTVYFGTSVTSIFKGLSTQCIQQCFWRGFVCVRGFDLKTRAPRPLIARLHFPASKLTKPKGKSNDKKDLPTSNS